MRGKKPNPIWDHGNLLSRREMYSLSTSPKGILKCLRRGKGHLGRISTYDNLHLLNGLEFTMVNGFAKVAPYVGPIDYDFYSICKWNPKLGTNCGIHAFAEDKDLDGRVWSRLEQTTYRIQECQVVVGPDYSMFVEPYMDAFNRNQVRKSRLVTAFWQSCGLNVVPLASWGNVDSFKYCLEGLPSESIIALSAESCHKTIRSWNLWCYAVTTVCETLHPIKLLIYGDPELKIPVDVPVMFIPDFIHTKLRKL